MAYGDRIKCLNGSVHTHETVEQVVNCIGSKEVYVTNIPPAGGNWVSETPPHWRSKTSTPTPGQLKYFGDLGGDKAWAEVYMTYAEVSKGIDDLLHKRRTPNQIHQDAADARAAMGGIKISAAVTRYPAAPPPPPPPAPAGTMTAYGTRESAVVPEPTPTVKRKSLFEGPFRELLNNVPDGYFAVRLEEGSPIRFIRVSRPKHGKYKDSIKVQTQHSETLMTRWVAWPSGLISIYDKTIEDDMMLLITNYQEYARLYAIEIGNCARCNTELTDEKSRYFGIGPECEKHWPWMLTIRREEAAENGEVVKF